MFCAPQFCAAAALVAVMTVCPSYASGFSASFKWCSKAPQSTTSPVFTLSSVPRGTTKISLQMHDHQAAYNHGGGEVAYRGGNVIPCGAIESGWVGPFPPEGQVHTYEFVVKALDGVNNVLGEAHALRNFPD